MLYHQPEQCVDTAVGLFIESGIKLLQQSEILHCVKRKAKVQPPFQFIGQRQQTDAEYFGMRIEINRNVLYIQLFLRGSSGATQGISCRQLGKQS